MEGLSCQDSIAALSLFMSAEGQCPLTLPVAAVAVAQGDRGGLITETSCIFVSLLLGIASQYFFITAAHCFVLTNLTHSFV